MPLSIKWEEKMVDGGFKNNNLILTSQLLNPVESLFSRTLIILARFSIFLYKLNSQVHRFKPMAFAIFLSDIFSRDEVLLG